MPKDSRRSRPVAGQRARVAAELRSRAGTATDPAPEVPHGQPPRGGTDRPGRVLAGTAVLDRATRRDAQAATAAGDRSRRRTWPLVVAGALALALAATTALLGLRVRQADATEAARNAALAAAEAHAVDILSYDYRHLDRDFAAAERVTTGKFARDYRDTTAKMVGPPARQYHAVVTAKVTAGSVVSATSTEAVVLLFVDQRTTSTRLDGPRVDENRVRLHLTRVDGSWLVSNVDGL